MLCSACMQLQACKQLNIGTAWLHKQRCTVDLYLVDTARGIVLVHLGYIFPNTALSHKQLACQLGGFCEHICFLSGAQGNFQTQTPPIQTSAHTSQQYVKYRINVQFCGQINTCGSTRKGLDCMDLLQLLDRHVCPVPATHPCCNCILVASADTQELKLDACFLGVP